MLYLQVIDGDGSGQPSPQWLNTPCVMWVGCVNAPDDDGIIVARDDLSAIRLVDGSVLVVVGNPTNVAERIQNHLDGIDEDESR